MMQDEMTSQLMAHASAAAYIYGMDSSSDQYPDLHFVINPPLGSGLTGYNLELQEFTYSTTTPKQTGFHAKIFTKKNSNNKFTDVIVAFTGTEPTKPSDVWTDLNLGRTQWDAKGVEVISYLNDNLAAGAKIYFTGHSLGGALAEYAAYDFLRQFSGNSQLLAAMKQNITLTTFNGLAGQQGLENRADIPYDPSLLQGVANYHYVIKGDVVSSLGKGHLGGNTLIINKVITGFLPLAITAHDIANFTGTTTQPVGTGGVQVANAAVSFQPDYINSLEAVRSATTQIATFLSNGDYTNAEAALRTVTALGIPVAVIGASGSAALIAYTAFVGAVAYHVLNDVTTRFSGISLDTILWIKLQLTDARNNYLTDYYNLPADTPEEVRLAFLDSLGNTGVEALSVYTQLANAELNLIDSNSGFTTSYPQTTTLTQYLSNIITDTRFIYQSAQSVGVPNLTLLRQQYMGNLTLLGAASQLKVQDFNLYSGLTAAQKQSQLIPLESSIVSGLVVPAQDVGYSATDLSTKLLKEVSVTDVAKGTAQLAENIGGFNAMMINDVAASDWTAGTSAVDNFNGTSANEVAFGYGGNDTLRGNDGNDALFGGAGNDTIYGGAGDDRLSGGDGVDTVYGGSGNDTFVLSGVLSLGDLLDGEAGVNTLVAQAHADLSLATLRNITNLEIESSDVSLMAAQFNLFVQYMAHGGSATLQAKTAGTYNLSGKTTSGRISLKGSAGSDVLVGDTKAQTLDGSAGVDQLTGGGGADIFKFTALTDSQYPGAMDLITDFTIGTDKIDVTGLGFTGLTAGTAGTGQLKLRYDSYYNFTYVYDTGTGFGFYMAGNKSALTAADFIGLPPSATVTISGTAGNDVLTGSDANDMLLGYAGADQLIGNSGNDVLDGGAGVDQLTGGAGLDVFRFTMLADSIFASDMDRIADFVKGEDKIDLTGLGFTGVTTGTPTAGQLKLSFDAYYNQTYLRDLNGSGFGFYMTGNQTTITNSDMIGLV